MAFRVTTFAGVTLPPYNWMMDFSTPKTRNPVIETLNGCVDFYGVRRRIEHSQEFELDAMPDPGVTPSAAAAAIRVLKTLQGKTGYLVRVNVDGSGAVQRYCRLIWVGFIPKSSQKGIVNKLTLRFWTNEPFWRSAAQTTHGPTAITSGANINLTIAGEEDVLDAVLTIAATANISTISVQHTKTENGLSIVSRLQKTTTLASGSSWVVDCGLNNVTVGGADAYASFALHITHNEVYWLRLPAGAQTLVITLGSGSGTYRLDYFPQSQ